MVLWLCDNRWQGQDFLHSLIVSFVSSFPVLPRRERDNAAFSFCLEKGCSGGVKVDPSGKGLLKVWKRQIQQFNRVSPEMAEAIVSAYPSPQLLVQVRMPQGYPALCAGSQLMQGVEEVIESVLN